MSGYPVVVNGQTLWACCVSRIGPTCQHRTSLPEVPARDKLTAVTKAKTTAQIMAAHAELERRLNAGEVTMDDKPASHLTLAVMADVVTERYGLDEELDRIFEDETFEGTYHNALELALDRVGRVDFA